MYTDVYISYYNMLSYVLNMYTHYDIHCMPRVEGLLFKAWVFRGFGGFRCLELSARSGIGMLVSS